MSSSVRNGVICLTLMFSISSELKVCQVITYQLACDNVFLAFDKCTVVQFI